MNFGFTEEQTLLREQARRFLDDEASMSVVRELMHSDQGFSTAQWQQLANLGWLGLIIDPDHGGVGLNWVDLIVVLEEMGRSLYPSPFISTTLAASVLGDLGSDEQKKDWLPRMATGQQIATLALFDRHGDPIADNITLAAEEADGLILNGTKQFVADAGSADLFITACRSGDSLKLALIPRTAEGVSVTATATMDRTKRTGLLELSNVHVAADHVINLNNDDLSRIVDKGVVAITAEMVGAGEQVLEITTGYARERIQFGHPIGKYQGVKHALADVYVDVESFKSLVYYAAWTIDHSPEELPRSASLAKAYASDAFAEIGINGVQLHGAIGFTEEYDIQLYLKRSKWARPIFGDSDHHYERVARMAGL